MDTCVVCGEPVDETNSAVCHGCGRRYHLVLKQGAQGKDCGNVWVDDLTTSLKFACRNCLNEAGADLLGGLGGATPPQPAEQGPPVSRPAALSQAVAQE